MKVSSILIALLAVAVIAVGLLLVSDDDERIAIMLRDGKTHAALIELRNLHAGGDRRPQIVLLLAKALARTGQTRPALELLDAHLEDHGTPLSILTTLAELARIENRRDLWFKAMARIVKLAPTTKRLHELAGAYRLFGRTEDEVELLSSSKVERMLGRSDQVRLARLLVGAGRRGDAIKWLMLADQRSASDDANDRVLLFCLLLEEGRHKEALRKARDWTGPSTADWQIVDLVRRAAILAPGDFARTFAEAMIDIKPKTHMAMVGTLANEGKRDLALAVLRSWIKRNPSADAEELVGYVAASRDLGNAAALFNLLVEHMRARSSRSEAIRLAEIMSVAYGIKALAPVHGLLDFQLLSERPLFAAEFALHAGNEMVARRFLRLLKPEQLTTSELRRWLVLVGALQPQHWMFAQLDALHRTRTLPHELLRHYADLALKLGYVSAYEAVRPALLRSPLP